jgi:hypothetical protein
MSLSIFKKNTTFEAKLLYLIGFAGSFSEQEIEDLGYDQIHSPISLTQEIHISGCANSLDRNEVYELKTDLILIRKQESLQDSRLSELNLRFWYPLIDPRDEFYIEANKKGFEFFRIGYDGIMTSNILPWNAIELKSKAINQSLQENLKAA